MVEDIRLHGYGGQGVVACGELIAIAASYEDKFCRAFPMYGSARRGAPVLAFAQIGEENEATRSMIYNPNNLVVLDGAMMGMKETTRGLSPNSTVLVNTPNKPENIPGLDSLRMAAVDATSIAIDNIGRPIPNTAMLGAFAKATGLLSLGSVNKAIDKRFKGATAESNKKAATEGYRRVKVWETGD